VYLAKQQRFRATWRTARAMSRLAARHHGHGVEAKPVEWKRSTTTPGRQRRPRDVGVAPIEIRQLRAKPAALDVTAPVAAAVPHTHAEVRR